MNSPAQIMLVLLTLSVARFSQLCAVDSPTSAEESPAANSNSIAGTVRVARTKGGTLMEPDATVERVTLEEAFPGIHVKLLSIEEASRTWGGSKSLLDATKSLTGEHYLLGLEDSMGKLFYETVCPRPIPPSVKKTVREGLIRQAGIVAQLEEAAKKSNLDRHRILVSVMNAVGVRTFRTLYPELAAELSRTDDDALKSAREQLAVDDKARERNEKVNRLHFDLSMELRRLPPDSTIEQRAARVDEFIKERSLVDDMKQVMIMRKYLIRLQAGHYTHALDALEEAFQCSPNSELAGRIPAFRETVHAKIQQSATQSAADPNKDIPADSRQKGDVDSNKRDP